MKQSLYIVWIPDNELGIPILDEQHRGIVSIINSFYYCMKKGRENEVMEPTLEMLLQYTIVHFRMEQRLMAEAGYPALQEHILLHEKLVEKTERIVRESPQERDADQALRFLKEWWLGHINTEDREYAPYLKKAAEAE